MKEEHEDAEQKTHHPKQILNKLYHLQSSLIRLKPVLLTLE
jgi:hypothetical protein